MSRVNGRRTVRCGHGGNLGRQQPQECETLAAKGSGGRDRHAVTRAHLNGPGAYGQVPSTKAFRPGPCASNSTSQGGFAVGAHPELTPAEGMS